jgi:hypothetical protein
MSSNSWVLPVSIISGLLVIGLGVSMYKNNKEATASMASYEKYLQQDDIDSRVGGKSKRRKHRKNASKKRR